MFTIGCDPELFLHHKGKFVSAIDLIGGSKQMPKPIGDVKGYAVQEDNVAVEFNVPPATSCEEFVKSIQWTVNEIEKMVTPYELSLSQAASASFPPDQLEHPKAKEFGCEPDYNAWTKRINPRPKTEDPNFRTCGGHVHVGTDLDPIAVVRAMDVFLGVPSVIIDTDTQRRKLYGKPGAYRKTSFGLEYRVLSNFWIWEKELIEMVFEQTQKALNFVKIEDCKKLFDVKYGSWIRNTIIQNNTREARKIIDHFGVL